MKGIVFFLYSFMDRKNVASDILHFIIMDYHYTFSKAIQTVTIYERGDEIGIITELL